MPLRSTDPRGLRARARATALGLGLALAGLTAAGASASTGPGPAAGPTSEARVHPGMRMVTEGSACTANFVFTDARGRLYLGYAAHCARAEAGISLDGCEVGSLPLGTPVSLVEPDRLGGGSQEVGRGRLAYSSWETMVRLGEQDPDACDYNDFALVRLSRGAARRVDPTQPVWGGPTAVAEEAAPAGARVFGWGVSGRRAGTTSSASRGVSLGSPYSRWSMQAYSLTPGVPGDSGGGLLDDQGRAVGVLVSLQAAPLAASNGYAALGPALAYAQTFSGIAGLALVPGGPFTG